MRSRKAPLSFCPTANFPKLSALNMCHLHLRRFILTCATLVIAQIASSFTIIIIGAICIIPPVGRITQAPSVTALGTLGIGAVTSCLQNIGCQLGLSAMQALGPTRLGLMPMSLTIRQPMARSYRPQPVLRGMSVLSLELTQA